MKHVVSILLFLSSTFIGVSQNSLEIFNSRNQSITKKELSNLKIWTTDSISFTGKLSILDDATIQVQQQNINLSNVTCIRTNTPKRWVWGGVLITGGTYLIVNSWINLNKGGLLSELNYIPLVAGVLPLACGIKLSIGKKYYSTDWSYEVHL